MGGPPRGLLALTILISIFGVLTGDDAPKWSQRSASNNGWVPLDTPCETCRKAAADLETQGSSGFASVASVPVAQPQPLLYSDSAELRPPPAPLRVQRQEATNHRHPVPEPFLQDQRPPPLPILKPTGGKQGRDHRFFNGQNPLRPQFNYLPENPQQQRVVFPNHQIQTQNQELEANIQSGRQQTGFLDQQRRPQIPAQHQNLVRNQQLQQNQHLQQQQQFQLPPRQVKLQSIPQNEFPFILPQSGLGHPHGFQNPQLHLLPVPHATQPSTQADIQSVLQHQLQNQLHHQINQQLLGVPFVSQFPPSAIGQQLQFPPRSPAVNPSNLHLLPQQPSRTLQASQAAIQQLELTSTVKPTPLPITTAQSDSPVSTKETVKNSFESNPEEEPEEEVQLLYVPVEALRQRGRVNKEAAQSQNSDRPAQWQKKIPDRVNTQSFQVKHPQSNFPNNQNLEQVHGNLGLRPNSFQQTSFPSNIANAEKERFQNQEVRADHGEATVLREEKQRFQFSPPTSQQFHQNVQLQDQRDTSYRNEQIQFQSQGDRYRDQSLEHLQQEEQQSAVSPNPAQNQGRGQHRSSQQLYRTPQRTQEENRQRIPQREQNDHNVQSIDSQTTSRPIPTQPIPTFTSTQGYVSTTPAPYQPPLSVYMEDIVGQGPNRLSVDDVLRSLNGASTVPVLERAGPNPPKVFVGPSVLRPPQGYAKFELPYLSMLDSNRVERKVDRLPFFVAPLSFQPPPGYAKIPFPAPHVGSVVVSSTPVQSTTERVFPVAQTTIPSALPQLVNSLQTPNSSPGELDFVPNKGGFHGEVSSTQQPSLQQVHQQKTEAQNFRQNQLPQQQLYRQQIVQQHFQQQQEIQQEFPQHPVSNQHGPQQVVQQQHVQQPPQQHNFQHTQTPPQETLRPQNYRDQFQQQQFPSQQFNSQNSQQFQHQQQQEQHLTENVVYTTPSLVEEPVYYQTTPSTTTTTTTTTTLAPQTRAPSHQRGRNRHRQSHTSTTSPGSDFSYRNRGNYRESASQETTRPSTRTRRPWDGRRRPSTTTEQTILSETTTYNTANNNQESSVDKIVSSTVRNTETAHDVFSDQSVKTPPQAITEQQYIKDDPYPQISLQDSKAQDGQLRNQGAFVLTAFQHPQVLGDVVEGQSQRPETVDSIRTYYVGQPQTFGSGFEVPQNKERPVVQQIHQSSFTTNEQSIASHGSLGVGVGNAREEVPSPQFQNNKDISGIDQTYDGERNDGQAKSTQVRGGHQNHPSLSRGQPNQGSPQQQLYQEEFRPVTQQDPSVETLYVNNDFQGTNRNTRPSLRTSNQRPKTNQNPLQNLPVQQVIPSQFTPSIQLSELPLNEQSTQLPQISNLHGNQQPQLFVISTPIPNPTQNLNRTYVNQQNYDIPQPVYEHQSYQEQSQSQEQKETIAENVNQGLATDFLGQQQVENSGQSYKFPSQQFAEDDQIKLTHRFQTTTTEHSIPESSTEGEPKRTRFRQHQKTFGGFQNNKASEGAETVEEERPRYRQQQYKNSANSRGRQSSQRTRGRHYTTESPRDDESGSPAPRQPQSQSSLQQRFRGRQQATLGAINQETTQYSETQDKVPYIQIKNTLTETSPIISEPVTEKVLISRPQSQPVIETHSVGDVTPEAYQPQHSDEQFRAPERQQPIQAQLPQEEPVEVERPSNVRSRGRFRGGGDRVVSRIRGQQSNQEGATNGNYQTRNQIQGQRYQHIPRRTPVQEIPYQETPRTPQEAPQPVSLSFGAPQREVPTVQKTEDENLNQGIPILIGNSGVTAIAANLQPVQGLNDESHTIVLGSPQSDGEQYEQAIAILEQESPVTQAVPVTTETTTTAVPSPKPGRKYGNFVSRGITRRPAQATAPLHVAPSTTPPPDNNPNKVYTVRPARRPVTKVPVNTRGRIRRPTTPTTTTTTTTPEPPYFLTTTTPIQDQVEYPTYDQGTSFGATRGGGNFRNRKRPATLSRRPIPSSNEVQPEEQDDEPARLQGTHHNQQQRTRGSSRRVSTLSPERIPLRSRQPEYQRTEEPQQPDFGHISQSAQGFRTEDVEGLQSQDRVQSPNFQSQSEEQHFVPQITKVPLRAQGKVKNNYQRPTYQTEDNYYSQETQQRQEIQEPRLKYQSPPNRATDFAPQEESEYAYEEQISHSSSPQPIHQKQNTDGEKEASPEGTEQKTKYEQQPQQDFVINFAAVSAAEDTGYDALDAGAESRYFEKPTQNHLRARGKLPQDNEKLSAPKSSSFPEYSEDVKSPDVSETSLEGDSEGNLQEKESKETVQDDPIRTEAKDTLPDTDEKPDSQPIKKAGSGRRRGSWVRVRTKSQRRRPGDMLETAESQNLATVSQNLLQFTPPVKEKTKPVWEDAPIEDVSLDEKEEESVAPVDDINETETFEDGNEPNSDEFISDMESDELILEQNEEALRDEPIEEIVELQDDDGTLAVEEVYDNDENLSDSSLLEQQNSSHSSTVSSEDAVNSNSTSYIETDKVESNEEENGISENYEHKTTQSESSTEQIENITNKSDETTDFTTEESINITTEVPTPRVLGTSTTTEISLETEICYRGRCVKTKIDADQVPIE